MNIDSPDKHTKNLAWLKVVVHHPPCAADALSSLLFAEGAAGIWEDTPDARGRQVTKAGFAPSEAGRLAGLLPAMVANLAEAFAEPVGEFDFHLAEETDQNWAEKWKEGLEPIVVAGRLIIAPTWSPTADLRRKYGDGPVLRLDPGLAFGSGHHASTFLCLYALTALAPAARRILDVGAGSGILSLAAAALTGEAEIVGIDNDPETISVAAANAELNQLAGRLDFSARALSELRPSFDLIAANITLNPLLELAPAITFLAGNRGRLILSGLLESQAGEAVAVYAAHGWGLERRLSREGWAALIFVKGRGAAARRQP
ncbi:MAG: 50S ribosomal protein L11 methyltransferase [Candidatus Adiutrix sp.]|jgi:ribosomal protein L11 methyltransferase|nr:50S ribosomal protein L11 methyltransferase [Candidatus Adiutrix sp.]